MTPTNPSLPGRPTATTLAASSPSPASSASPKSSPAPAPAPAAEPTHPCARCGAPVAPGIGLCERCNPLGLRDSAASQMHGTVFGVVALTIVLLLVVARLSIAGSGPFPASVSAVSPTADGLALTLTITNQGTQTGQTTCRVVDASDKGISGSAFVLSPRIAAGQTISFRTVVIEFGASPRELAVTCRTP